jgi:hypothetical protein
VLNLGIYGCDLVLVLIAEAEAEEEEKEGCCTEEWCTEEWKRTAVYGRRKME